jgi:hypothetical protein
LRPRRGDAPTEAALPRQRRSGGEAGEDEREQRREPLDARSEPDAPEVDASLRPLARALLALAEQLRREEGP